MTTKQWNSGSEAICLVVKQFHVDGLTALCAVSCQLCDDNDEDDKEAGELN